MNRSEIEIGKHFKLQSMIKTSLGKYKDRRIPESRSVWVESVVKEQSKSKKTFEDNVCAKKAG